MSTNKPSIYVQILQREQFEARFKKPPYEFDLRRYRQDQAWPGNYVIYAVQCAWVGFQAGQDAPKNTDKS